MSIKRKKKPAPPKKQDRPIVTFLFEERTYQIDKLRRKVYRGFVEIETSRSAEIFSIWRSRQPGV